MIFLYSQKALTGGLSTKLAVTTGVSAQTAVLSDSYAVVVMPTVDVYFRRGVNPTAVSDGTDQFLLANITYRLTGFGGLDKLSFIASTSGGSVYITAGA